MSGLEVAATVVGIVSLGVQIGEGILRLKAFATSIKEAPKDVQRFIDELDILNHVFTEIATAHKTGQLDDLPGSSAKECLSLCQNAADILYRVVKEVNSDIERRKIIGSMKFVLKQSSIDRLRSSLHSAQLMLILSKQTLMEARNQAAHEKQRSWESNLQKEVQYLRSMTLTSPTSASSSELSRQCQTQDLSRDMGMLGDSEMYPKEDHCGTKELRKVAKTQKRLLARIGFNATSWFNGHVWELHYSKTFSSINFSLHYHNIVSRNSPIMISASSGDFQEVKRLLRSGQATLYDTDSYGSSLFYYAIDWSDIEFCKWLIDAGMDPNFTDWALWVDVRVFRLFNILTCRKA
ncbi:hypothetical protein B0O99DRAFT_226795 [Bisporella sp. PMI_857]|nr:hypothetical protein B0O99DRAFT_226795 [Bisporella sp. PMI_857]